MSEQTFSSPIPGLKQALEETAARVRQTAARAAWYGLLWRWLALVAVLFVLDLLLGLPVWLRWAGLMGQAGFVLWSLRAMLTRRARRRVEAERAARLVEERHPEMDNALINAVQFQRTIDAVPPAQASLMRREMERAESAVSHVPVRDAVNREPEQRASKLLAGGAGVWVLAALLFPNGLRTVLPRLLMPWMDDSTPPFSLTRFDVRPPGATVRFGDSLAISVSVSGPQPDSLALLTRTPHSAWQRIALDSAEPGQYSATLESLREDTWFFVQGGRSRSARYRIRVLTPPAIKSLRVTYTYPAYTRKPPATETLGDPGIHGLLNTGVALEIGSNRPLSGGELLIRTAGGAPQKVSPQLDPKDPSRAVARFTLVRSGVFRVSLTGEDGMVNPEAARGKITLDRDERPVVWINHPGQDLLVTPEMAVPIQVEAEDDIGVQRVELHRVVNDLGDSPRSFSHPPPAARMPGSRHVDDTLTMDLADLGVRPGDRITYYATAYDNHPIRPNRAETEPYTIKVVTREEYLEALKEQRAPEEVTREAGDIVSAVQQLAERQQQLAEKMERLRKQLAAKPGDAGLRQQWQAARQEQKALQAEARQLAQAMQDYARSPSTSDIEQAIKNRVAQMARQMSSAANRAMQQAQSGDPAPAARSAGQAASQLAAVNRQMQQQVEKTIEHLEKIMPLYNDIERFMALLERQGQLVLRAREFQEQASAGGAARAKLEALGTEQSRIREELKQLQQDLRLHAQACQGDFPRAARSAFRIAGEIDQRQIPDLMQTGGDRFRQWSGPEGFDSAQRALRQMQAMVHDCQGSQGSSQGELDIALSRSLGRSGLGRSLAQMFARPGGGSGSGDNGSGSGPGGLQAGPAGQSGGAAMHSERAYVPGIPSAGGTAGPRRRKGQNAMAGPPAGLAPEDIDLFPSPVHPPPKAGDTGSGRYPAEYRKLISDYFKSVAEKG